MHRSEVELPREVPQPSRVDKKREAEPFAEEGTQFVRDHLMQRDATVQVLGIDKQGNCHGLVWCMIDGKETQLSEALTSFLQACSGPAEGDEDRVDAKPCCDAPCWE